MMQTPLRWRLGLYASLAMMLLAAYPQARVWLARGSVESNSYAFFSEDEAAYCAYVNALIEGRPRRNDPYTGRDNSAEQPQPESLFSIQFIPPYTLAFIARMLGLSAPCIFFVLTCLATLASSLAVFWMIHLLTGDDRVAAAAIFFILCLGTFALVYGPVRMLFGLETTYSFSHLPFLRRYQPAAPFALLFVFCALVWRALTDENDRVRLRSAVLAGLTFAVLIFSYFYLWTAAAAWLACLSVLWLLMRPENFRRGIKSLAIIGVIAAAALLPYAYLLSYRAPMMDTMQLLALSHAPDFSRSSERLGVILILLLIYLFRRGRIASKNQLAIFALSLAIAPLIIFNQQIITGRSLQPLHYEMYITKYLTLVSLVLVVTLYWRSRKSAVTKLPTRALVAVALIAFGWSIIETVVATSRALQSTLGRDEVRHVAARFAEMSRGASGQPADIRSIILYTNLTHADSSPTLAPQPVLWAPHTPAFSGVSWQENKERIYRLLYFTGFDETSVNAQELEKLDSQRVYLLRSLVGWGHADAAWSVNWQPVTTEELQAELRGYADFRAHFNREQAAQLPLSYFVTTTDEGIDISNLDHWYERDAGERLGKFVLYRVKLKP